MKLFSHWIHKPIHKVNLKLKLRIVNAKASVNATLPVLHDALIYLLQIARNAQSSGSSMIASYSKVSAHITHIYVLDMTHESDMRW